MSASPTEELARLTTELERRRPTRSEALRFPELYRRAVHELADGRAQKKPRLEPLEAAVRRAHGLLYGSVNPAADRSLREFLSSFPRAVRRNLRGIAFAYALMAVGTAFGYAEVRRSPASAEVLVSPALQENADRFRGEGQTGAQGNPVNSFAYFTNNSKVAFTTFALGVTYGVGTLLVLFFNGLELGATAALVQMTRSPRALLSWLLPHGGVELTAIAIAAAGGLLMARAMISPGFRRRRDALAQAAAESLPLALGATMLLVVAGLTEAWIAPKGWPLPYKAAIGFALDSLLVVYLALWGRAPEARPPPAQA